MNNYKFIIKESPEYIEGEIFYKNNEFIFESKDGNGEFSLMIGKGYCELSIAKFNSRIYSFGGVNFKENWINDGIWYTENWNTYYDEKNNFICIGDSRVNTNSKAVEFCKNIVAVIEKDELKAIWIKNIKFK